MPNVHTVILSEQITELKRELKMRETNYPKWIEANTLDPARASGQLARIKATLHLLVELEEQLDGGPQSDLFKGTLGPQPPAEFLRNLGRRRDEFGSD